MFKKAKKYKKEWKCVTVYCMSPIAERNKIEEILSRSISDILPSKNELIDALASGKQLKIYIGADATGPELHIGHATNFILLEKLRKLGHKIVILFGDFTAMIGDPTDKDTVRKKITEHEVKENMRQWKAQVGRILDFEDKDNPARIEKNSAWFSKMTLSQMVDLMSRVTVGQVIERDMFQERIKKKKPIYLHEFLYPLLQGYDSVELGVDVEVGGTDQTFNMLMGRTLLKQLKNKEKFVITTPLLENPRTGRKLMSKSEGGYISLNDSPSEMFGKAMALPDETILSVLTLSTHASLEEIKKIENDLKEGGNPRDAKMKLAHELVSTYHSKKEADKAEQEFVSAFQKRTFPADAKKISVSKGTFLRDILLEKNIIVSKNEYKRLIEGGAFHDTGSGDVIKDEKYKIEKDINLKIGKKKFFEIRVS